MQTSKPDASKQAEILTESRFRVNMTLLAGQQMNG